MAHRGGVLSEDAVHSSSSIQYTSVRIDKGHGAWIAFIHFDHFGSSGAPVRIIIIWMGADSK